MSNIGITRGVPQTPKVDVQVFTVAAVQRINIYLPGVAGLYISSPNAAWNQITGDISLRFRAQLPSWSAPTATAVLGGKWNNTANAKQYLLQVTTTGLLEFAFTTNGSTNILVDSTVVVPFGPNVVGWVRADRVSATGVVTFYTSLDGTDWTQLGATVTSTSGAMFNGTTEIELGATNVATTSLLGAIYNVEIWNGAAGAGSVKGSFAGSGVLNAVYTDPQGNVWTVHGVPATAAGFGTWTKPANCSYVRVACIGAGSGGAGGSSGAAAATVIGGGGGSGGCFSWIEVLASDLPAAVPVQVGKGGPAQGGQGGTNVGACGTAGGDSIFGPPQTPFCLARGGLPTPGNGSSSGASTITVGGQFRSGGGGNGGSTGNGSTGGGCSFVHPLGGGGGGAAASSSTAHTGANGSAPNGITPPAGGAIAGGAGAAGLDFLGVFRNSLGSSQRCGGAGGGSSVTAGVNGGAGGNGDIGAGGGGGGALAASSGSSGGGGNGGDGLVVVVSW